MNEKVLVGTMRKNQVSEDGFGNVQPNGFIYRENEQPYFLTTKFKGFVEPVTDKPALVNIFVEHHDDLNTIVPHKCVGGSCSL